MGTQALQITGTSNSSGNCSSNNTGSFNNRGSDSQLERESLRMAANGSNANWDANMHPERSGMKLRSLSLTFFRLQATLRKRRVGREQYADAAGSQANTESGRAPKWK